MMSGGAMDYIYQALLVQADKIPDREIKDLTEDLAEVLHALEWHLSGDTCEGSWLAKAAEFREKWLRDNSRQRLMKYAEQMCDDVKRELLELFGMAEHCKDCASYTHGAGTYGHCAIYPSILHHEYEPSCGRYERRRDDVTEEDDGR